jgi:hypothetical protein
MSVKEASSRDHFERGEKQDGTNSRCSGIQTYVKYKRRGANEVIRHHADQDKSFEDLQLNAATIASSEERHWSDRGRETADGGITPEENDDLRRERKRNKGSSQTTGTRPKKRHWPYRRWATWNVETGV